jgi:hypothetical protein
MHPYYFLHIPKTAGTSLMRALDRQFAPGDVCPDQLWHQLVLRPLPEQQRLGEFRLFRGHFYGMLADFVGRGLTTFTFVRDPIERALSHFAHVMRETHHYLHMRAVAVIDLGAFIRDPVTRPMVYNFQTRSLAMQADIRELAASLDDAQIRGLAIERMIETWMPAPHKEQVLLDRAQAEVDRMLMVGLTERYADSLVLLDHLTGWRTAESDPAPLNVSPERLKSTSLHPAIRTELEQATELDRELYHYASQRWDRQWQSFSSGSAS